MKDGGGRFLQEVSIFFTDVLCPADILACLSGQIITKSGTCLNRYCAVWLCVLFRSYFTDISDVMFVNYHCLVCAVSRARFSNSAQCVLSVVKGSVTVPSA